MYKYSYTLELGGATSLNLAMSHEDALNLAGVILRGHKSPEAPEQSQAQLPEEEPPDSIFISQAA